MRDPDLMQRADRAAITLEQAWERWRAMHGLGAEPLPPVSSYVGYSLEEPWGQPRVVFGLRADEAELLASLLDGHDCVGTVYSEAGARLDWRLPVSGPVSIPGRGGYGGPLNVPAQAPPPGTDLLSPSPPEVFPIDRMVEESGNPADEREDEAGRGQVRRNGSTGTGPANGRSTRAARPARRRTSEAASDVPELAAQRDEAGWSASDGDPQRPDDEPDAAAMEVAQSPPLAPLPDEPDLRMDEATAGEPEPLAESAPVAPRAARTGTGQNRGPGYRGPRYQGFPPRYEPGQSGSKSAARQAVADDDDEDGATVGAELAPGRKTHAAAKLSRSARRRTQGG